MEEFLKQIDKACKEIAKSDEKYYLKQKFNENMIPILKKHRLFGLPVEKRYGGLRITPLDYVTAFAKIGKVGFSLRTFLSVHNMGQVAIQRWGNEQQRKRYLTKTSKGEKIMAFALTEDEAGSDPASLKTTYTKKGKNYILNGKKTWISSATVADVIITFARNVKDKTISAFIVEKNFKGFSTERIENKVGLRSTDTGSIFYKDCVVPQENMLGEEGHGLRVAYWTIMHGRLGVAAGCVGSIESCLEECVEYAKKRIQHGEPIARKQLIQQYIAMMKIQLDASRLLVIEVAHAKYASDSRPDDVKLRDEADYLIAQAKYYASNAAFDVADKAMQIFGKSGYSLENRVARHFVDTRVTRIYEGTDEIMLLKIASHLLGKDYEAF